MESNEVENKMVKLNTSKKSEGDNLEDIKKFIEDEEGKVGDPIPSTSSTADKKEVDATKDFDERLAVASSMMDMIVNESEARLSRKKENKSNKNNTSTGDKGNNSMALSVGSKVEAKDFSEDWYPAKIVEVDYEEMEVLVHYENSSKRHDEWISVSSPRLRPLSMSSKPTSPAPSQAQVTSTPNPGSDTVPVASKDIKQEPKLISEDKPKFVFAVGERCLARWRDNRRFTATVNKVIEDGHYEVVFDDGFLWKCTTSRLYKMKDSKTDGLTVDTTVSSPGTPLASPAQYGAGPSSALPLQPAYHTHLFDPTRDYLGSKSERREMKRKLNIKEIFNIGQKKKKIDAKDKVAGDTPVVKKKPKLIRKKPEPQPAVTVKTEIPDAVASIIGTVKEEASNKEVKKEKSVIDEYVKEETTTPTEINQDEAIKTEKLEVKEEKIESCTNSNTSEKEEDSLDPVQKEEVKLEKFDKIDDTKHEEVIDRIKEVINKLEDGINKVQNSPKPEVKEEPPKVEPEPETIKPEVEKEPVKKEPVKKEPVKKESVKDRSKKLAKVKKGKKLRLLQEKKVKKQVEKVKSELEEMKRQVEEMRKQMMAKTEELAKGHQEMPESFLLPGEWCCKWVNGQPVGTVSELDAEVRDANAKPGLPRRSVQVEDKRLPPGWTKHMVRRSLGNSAGKWDVVLVSPDNRRFHMKSDMKNFMENNPIIKEYEHALMDFGVHLKLARRMGWVKTTPGGGDETPVIPLPAGTLCSTSPLVKRRKLTLKKVRQEKEKKRKLAITIRMPKYLASKAKPASATAPDQALAETESAIPDPPLEDGFVYVGSLKVQILENLLRCPADGCFKNFRNNTLLKMHIKHYHRELRKMLGKTPKVLDLAYARTLPISMKQTRVKGPKVKSIKTKIRRPPKRVDEPKVEVKEPIPEKLEATEVQPMSVEAEETVPKQQDSPKLRLALINKPAKRPRVLLPVRRPEPEFDLAGNHTDSSQDMPIEPVVDIPLIEALDFETAISTHTVTKPLDLFSKKRDKKKIAVLTPKLVSEDEDWFGVTSDVETRSSFPRSGTPDSKNMDQKLNPVSSESNEDQKESNYMYTENGERIKIVHMKREEIINCHCGFREEDGLMVQCELCLCWQHALCHNIQKESEVPEKYTCSICLNPRRGRRSQRFLHDQDRLYEGLLPGAGPSEPLRRSHELSGNLLRIQDALHALRVKYYVATKKDHPKLYLWAKDWENGELNISQERLISDYSDLNVMISSIGKENMPLKPEDLKDQMELQTPPSEEHDRYSQREVGMGSQTLLSSLLSSPGGAALDLPLPLSAAELERLAKTVQEEVQRVSAPQPEAAIENSACRERLLRHIQRCQAVIDARLDSIEAQVAELESQDPSFEDDETADYFPRTKQTIQMLMRDLDTMEELGVIT